MQPDRFTIKSREAIEAAQQLADERRNPQTTPEHVLAVLLEQDGGIVVPILRKPGVDPAAVRQALGPALDALPQLSGGSAAPEPAGGSTELTQVLRDAEKEMRELEDEYVSTEHLMLAVAAHPGRAGDALRSNGATRDALLKALKEVRSHRVTDESPEEKFQALERFGRDLTEAAAQGKLDPVIGRDDEIRRVIQVLSRRTKNNPVLIGEPGVGKTAIAEGLAQRIVAGDVPEGLKDRRVIALDLGAMVAGSKYRGEFEDRLKAVLKEITDASPTPTLTGEDIYEIADFEKLCSNHAVDKIHPDLSTSGGILRTHKIGDMAYKYGVPMAMHFAGTPVACMANVHCAAATRNFLALENHSLDVPWWQDLVNEVDKPVINRGYIAVPDSPGLGVTLNDDVMRQHLAPGVGYFEPTPMWDSKQSFDDQLFS